MQIITAKVSIGKSKKITEINFLLSDFIRIQNNILILKNERKIFKLSTDEKNNLIKSIIQL